MSQKWLDSLGIIEREVRIDLEDKYYFVDGFNLETNTVYEFLGDYWHGNLRVHRPFDINKQKKMTFLEIYKETMTKIRDLENAGYKVVYIWEKEYKYNRLNK